MSVPQSRSKYIKTLIVDDNDLARSRLKRLLSAHEKFLVIGEAADGLMAQNKVVELKPELIFMDIEMPFLNGIEVARNLGAIKPLIVFVTAFDAYAVRAFEVNAVDYLLKPIQNSRLIASLDKILKQIEQGAPFSYERYLASPESFKRNRKISLIDGKDTLAVNMDDISLISTEGRYSRVFYQDKNILLDEALSQLITRLDKNMFLFAHRNTIVNIKFIEKLKRQGIRKYVLVMQSPIYKEIAVSRGCLETIKRAFMEDRVFSTTLTEGI